MGKFDYCMKEYLQNKEYFADLFNGCCFDGQTVIRAEDLTEASETYTVARTEEEEDNADFGWSAGKDYRGRECESFPESREK